MGDFARNLDTYNDGWAEMADSEPMISVRQREILEHSLGDPSHYRNHFATDESPNCPGYRAIRELVEMGLMKRGRAIPGGLVYYHVTKAGKALAFPAPEVR